VVSYTCNPSYLGESVWGQSQEKVIETHLNQLPGRGGLFLSSQAELEG
jgi:hypothetical protein